MPPRPQPATEFDPAQPLSDAKRERFVYEIACGVAPFRAFVEAGFKRPRSNCSRLMREPEVVARLQYLRKQQEPFEATLIALRRAELRGQLEAIAGLDRTDLFSSDGQFRIKPPSEWTEEQRKLVEGVRMGRYGAELVMPSKLGALAQLAKLDSLDQPTKVDHSGKIRYRHEDVQSYIAQNLCSTES